MTRPYALGTTVSAEKSRAEIDAILSKHGATNRGIQVDDHACLAVVAFVISGTKYRIDVPMPANEEPDVRPRGWSAWSSERRRQFVEKNREQACRERWRAVVLLLKAKMEFVRIGAGSIEREFVGDMVLKNGLTVFENIHSQQKILLMLGNGDK